MLTVPQIYALADAIAPRYRALILLATFASLRWAELAALTLPALAAVGLSGVHFHDLRHTGNQFSADAGASLRELMEHMGHDSARAALIYLHMSAERQRAIADRVGSVKLTV